MGGLCDCFIFFKRSAGLVCKDEIFIGLAYRLQLVGQRINTLGMRASQHIKHTNDSARGHVKGEFTDLRLGDMLQACSSGNPILLLGALPLSNPFLARVALCLTGITREFVRVARYTAGGVSIILEADVERKQRFVPVGVDVLLSTCTHVPVPCVTWKSNSRQQVEGRSEPFTPLLLTRRGRPPVRAKLLLSSVRADQNHDLAWRNSACECTFLSGSDGLLENGQIQFR